MWKELRTLKKQYKLAAEEERQPLVELRDIKRKKLMSLQKAKRDKRRTVLITSPFVFMKKLLEDKQNSHLECSPDKVDAFLHNTPVRKQELSDNKPQIRPAPPIEE